MIKEIDYSKIIENEIKKIKDIELDFFIEFEETVGVDITDKKEIVHFNIDKCYKTVIYEPDIKGNFLIFAKAIEKKLDKIKRDIKDNWWN